jgi:predicted nucleic acid-binding protein
MVFLDANPIIYHVEQPPVWGRKATARLAALRAAGEDLAVTELVRMECLVGPVQAGDASVEADFAAFFSAPHVRVLPITTAVAERAARIRAAHRFKPLDALHPAAAVEHGCGLFLTNDAGLKGFPDLTVEILT